VAEVDFAYLEDEIVELTYQLRDHDGAGEMLPFDPMVEYPHGTEFVLEEMIFSAMNYMALQKKKYEEGIAANARRLGYTVDIHACPI
jgi:hypothetical protein